MIFLFIDFSCLMVLHRGAQKILVKNLYSWPNSLIFGSKWPKFGQNQQFSAKMAFFQGPWIFFSRVFCKNDFGYLFSIPLRTCVPSFNFLGHSGAILIGGAIMAPPVPAKESHMPCLIGFISPQPKYQDQSQKFLLICAVSRQTTRHQQIKHISAITHQNSTKFET